jgi:hypothetical protein
MLVVYFARRSVRVVIVLWRIAGLPIVRITFGVNGIHAAELFNSFSPRLESISHKTPLLDRPKCKDCTPEVRSRQNGAFRAQCQGSPDDSTLNGLEGKARSLKTFGAPRERMAACQP